MTTLAPAPSSADLHGGVPGDWLAVLDISQGAWRARDAALQLAETIGARLPAIETLYDGEDAETIARGVDAEARGPLPVLVGYRDARALFDLLPEGARLALIHDPDCPPEDENHWFLLFLERMGMPVERIATTGGRAPPAPEGITTAQRALLAFFPGPLPPALAAAAGFGAQTGLFLPGTDGVIAPAWRHLPDVTVAHLARFEGADERIRLICQMRGAAYYADVGWLTDQAMAMFRAGAVNLALRLLGRACDIATDISDRATAELSLQGIRIFSHRYDEAARHPDPAPDLPGPVRDQLSVLKAWAEMFGADPGAGLTRIDTAFARAGRADPPSTEDLFILNIAALGQLRTGRHDAALDTELKIKRALGRAEDIDYRAEFINAINLSRLYRRRGDGARFRSEVDRAMATSDGLRSLSDILQMNLIRATPGGSDAPAADHVLRAALAWLALCPPEAIAIRALRQLSPGASHGPDTPARVSDALAERMQAAFPGLVPAESAPARFSFIEGMAPPGSMAIAIPAAALLRLPDDAPATACHAPCAARDRLSGLVVAAIALECPGLADAGPMHLGIECDNGFDIPAGDAGLRGLVLRHAIDRSLGPAGETRWSAQDRVDMGRAARVWRSNGVARITAHYDAQVVVFKRYRAPLVLEGGDAALVAELGDDGPTTETLAARSGVDPAAALTALQNLAVRRVIRLEVQDA